MACFTSTHTLRNATGQRTGAIEIAIFHVVQSGTPHLERYTTIQDADGQLIHASLTQHASTVDLAEAMSHAQQLIDTLAMLAAQEAPREAQ